MKDRRFLLFSYTYPIEFQTVNLGDFIQTLCVRDLLLSLGARKENFEYFDRDSLSYYNSKTNPTCIMNGWFSHSVSWVPSPSIHPIYSGFHLTDTCKDLIRSQNYALDHIKSQPIIGCRDLPTRDFLQGMGVSAYASKCLTLTRQRREKLPARPKNFMVNVPEDIMRDIKKRSPFELTYINQRDFGPIKATKENQAYLFQKAQKLLDLYRDEAGLVITSAIHCAMPCVAMGVPVIFISPYKENSDDGRRISVISDILPIYGRHDTHNIDWDPPTVDIEETKDQIKSNICSHLEKNVCKISEIINKEIKKNRKNNFSQIILHSFYYFIVKFIYFIFFPIRKIDNLILREVQRTRK